MPPFGVPRLEVREDERVARHEVEQHPLWHEGDGDVTLRQRLCVYLMLVLSLDPWHSAFEPFRGSLSEITENDPEVDPEPVYGRAAEELRRREQEKKDTAVSGPEERDRIRLEAQDRYGKVSVAWAGCATFSKRYPLNAFGQFTRDEDVEGPCTIVWKLDTDEQAPLQEQELAEDFARVDFTVLRCAYTAVQIPPPPGLGFAAPLDEETEPLQETEKRYVCVNSCSRMVRHVDNASRTTEVSKITRRNRMCTSVCGHGASVADTQQVHRLWHVV